MASPFLSAAEFQAGERLRADYTRGQIMPRLSANWVASVASGRRDGGVADLTDAALAARQRVEQAISAVGPELSGVLIDVCCFLKGMETVEVERGWPVRSAKVVLKTALGVLSRHYNPAASRQGRSPHDPALGRERLPAEHRMRRMAKKLRTAFNAEPHPSSGKGAAHGVRRQGSCA